MAPGSPGPSQWSHGVLGGLSSSLGREQSSTGGSLARAMPSIPLVLAASAKAALQLLHPDPTSGIPGPPQFGRMCCFGHAGPEPLCEVCGDNSPTPPRAVTCWAPPQDLAERGKWERKREVVWPLVACDNWPKCLVPPDWTGPPEPREEEGAPLGQCPPCHTSPRSSRALGSSCSQLQWKFCQVPELGFELPPGNN